MSYEVTKSIMRTASASAVATTAATVVCGAIEHGNPAAAVNAISHIFWGDTAARQDGVSAKYTANGVALNSAAMVPWAALHHLLFRPHARRSQPAVALASGAVTAAIAYVVDYHVVPNRLTPGFEKRLSNVSVLAIYAALAVALARSARSDRPPQHYRDVSDPLPF